MAVLIVQNRANRTVSNDFALVVEQIDEARDGHGAGQKALLDALASVRDEGREELDGAESNVKIVFFNNVQ